MRRAVEQLEQRFDRADRRVVLVLPDRREASAWRLATSCSGKSGRRTMSSTIASTSSKSSDRHVQRRPSHAATSRRAARRRGRRALRRARRRNGARPAIEDAPEQVGQAGPVERLVNSAGADGRVDRDGRRGRRLLNDDDGAVREHRSNRRQSAHAASSRAPAVSLPLSMRAGTSRRCGSPAAAGGARRPATSVGVTARPATACRSKNPGPVTVSKYPSWCAMFVTLSVSKTNRARSCRRARATSSSLTPPSRTRSISSTAAASSAESDTPCIAVSEIV